MECSAAGPASLTIALLLRAFTRMVGGYYLLDSRAHGPYNTFMDASTRQAIVGLPPKTCAGKPHDRPSSGLMLVGASESVRLGIGDSDQWLCWGCYAALYAIRMGPADSEPTETSATVAEPIDISEWHTIRLVEQTVGS